MPESESQKASAVVFECSTPILRAESLSASLDFYTGALGFKLDFESEGNFASVSRDRCGLYLCEGDQGNAGTWVWIGVEDIEPLYTDYLSKGVKVRHPPTNYPWAFEMQIEDPDGHVLRFGSEPKSE
jgi:predicted enzyme related to lactoylglutathione lyase